MPDGLEVAELIGALEAQRPRFGPSPTDVARRAGLDRGFISKRETGNAPNPTAVDDVPCREFPLRTLEAGFRDNSPHRAGLRRGTALGQY